MAGLYLHVPFCRSKCAYCDFYSTPDVALISEYPRLLLLELELRTHEITEPYSTIYIGGGTPSLLPDRALEQLMAGLAASVDLGGMSEITIEANPEDISVEKLAFYRSLGINRISIGVQSFSDDELSAVSRRHTAAGAVNALDVLKASGINFNADLMYGLPGQTPEILERHISRMLMFKPPHLSAYLLSYEPGTRLYARRERGLVTECDEQTAETMYDMVCSMLAAAGYEHYEISNFALPGYHSRHNSAYWTYTPYLGLGAGAHSFDGVMRRYNPASLKHYSAALEQGVVCCVEDEESADDKFNDYIITSMRTASGFDCRFADDRFGEKRVKEFDRNVRMLASGLVERTNDGHYVIPEKLWLRSDAIMRDLMV